MSARGDGRVSRAEALTGPPALPTTRLVLADDHPTFLSGLAALLATQPDLAVVGTASTGHEVDVLVRQQRPDVVLLDLQMPGVGGLDVLPRLTSAGSRVVVLTMIEDGESVLACMRAGALGYILKGARPEEILRAVRAVAVGEAIFSPTAAKQILAYVRMPVGTRGPAFPELTIREREVLALIAAGHDNTAIARRLFLSGKTVRNHVSNIFTKLQVRDRAEAIVKARRAGLGDDDQR